MIQGATQALTSRPGLAQFIKFCVVGLSSFTIDIGLLNLFLYQFGWPLLVSKAGSFLVGVGNGFYWNRRWTFRAQTGDPRRQYPKFVLTNAVGLLLNLSIMTGTIVLATKLGLIHQERTPGEIAQLILRGEGRRAFNPLTVNLATLAATVCVTAWNFTAAKFITFRK